MGAMEYATFRYDTVEMENGLRVSNNSSLKSGQLCCVCFRNKTKCFRYTKTVFLHVVEMS